MPPARKTFRSAVNDVAWQKQLRDRHNREGTPPVPHLNVKQALVKPVTSDFAKQIIYKYEWLGTMSNSSYHYGIFFGPFCAGVTCVAVGTGTGGNNVAKMFGLEHRELATLVRGANVHWSPPNANSKLVSFTCKLVGKDSGAQLIIAYADTDAGEIGTIYQACGWHYIGRGSSTTQYIAPNGRIYDQRNISHWSKNFNISWGDQRDRLLKSGWREQASNPKHRYVSILNPNNRNLVRLVESLILPYPKRDHAGEKTGS